MEKKQIKKPFVEPRLTVYGDIRQITLSTTMVNHGDGNLNGNTKTG